MQHHLSMTLTLDVPDELVAFLPQKESDLVAVLSAGLRRLRGSKKGEVQQFSDVAEALANLPSPEEVLALRPSPQFAERTEELRNKSKEGGLDPEEQTEWEEIMRVEHLVRMAKTKAAMKLKAA